MKLIDTTGKQIRIGDKVSTSDDEQAIINEFHPPPDSGKSGKVRVTWCGAKSRNITPWSLYYVTVFNLKFVKE